VYLVEFSTGILRENPVSASGSAKITPTGVDEAAVFNLQFASGCLANLACGFTYTARNNAIIYGSSGRIELDSCYKPVNIERYDADGRLAETFAGRMWMGSSTRSVILPGSSGTEGRKANLVPLEDSVACAEVFDILRKQWGLK